MSRRLSTTKFARQRGAVIIAALVCLLIVVALIGAMLQGTLRARRQMPVLRDRVQCDLLLQAGAARAAYRLASEADYRGETWNLPADAIAGAGTGSGTGQVTITATRAPAAEANTEATDPPWHVSVVAEYPLGDLHSIRRSRTSVVPAHSTQP